MRALLLSLLISVGSSVAIAAPADQPGHVSPAPGTNSEAMSAVKDTTAGAVGAVSAEMTHSTKGFATAAAISDMYEIAAAKVALDRSNNQEIRAFAQRMIDAHTKSTETLKGLLPPNMTPPAHVDDRRQGMLDDLRGASGADFDHRYIVQQVAAHREADTLMRGYAKDGDNQAIKDFASTMDKTVKMHLAAARALARKNK